MVGGWRGGGGMAGGVWRWRKSGVWKRESTRCGPGPHPSRPPATASSTPFGFCSPSQVVALERPQGGGGRVAGVLYADADGTQHSIAADAVVLATGGFGASATLLKQHAPQVRVYVCVCMRQGWGSGRRLCVDGMNPSVRPEPTRSPCCCCSHLPAHPALPRPAGCPAAHHQRALGAGRGPGAGGGGRGRAAAPRPGAGAPHRLC